MRCPFNAETAGSGAPHGGNASTPHVQTSGQFRSSDLAETTEWMVAQNSQYLMKYLNESARQSELRSLLSRIERGDEDAMGNFYQLTKPPLISYILQIVRDVTTAEEVLQDTLCQIWLNAPAYRADRSALATWLYLIARSRAVDALRRKQRTPFAQQPLEDCEGRTAARDAEEEQVAKLHQTQLKRYLQDLPAIHRQLIHLAFFEGYSHAEIALAMNLPLGTVKSRIRLAVARLRERFF
jgi:RNA polymerase sigma-70 factor (ECF subfamily)